MDKMEIQKISFYHYCIKQVRNLDEKGRIKNFVSLGQHVRKK